MLLDPVAKPKPERLRARPKSEVIQTDFILRFDFYLNKPSTTSAPNATPLDEVP